MSVTKDNSTNLEITTDGDSISFTARLYGDVVVRIDDKYVVIEDDDVRKMCEWMAGRGIDDRRIDND
jgi:hypothetical protein